MSNTSTPATPDDVPFKLPALRGGVKPTVKLPGLDTDLAVYIGIHQLSHEADQQGRAVTKDECEALIQALWTKAGCPIDVTRLDKNSKLVTAPCSKKLGPTYRRIQIEINAKNPVVLKRLKETGIMP